MKFKLPLLFIPCFSAVASQEMTVTLIEFNPYVMKEGGGIIQEMLPILFKEMNIKGSVKINPLSRLNKEAKTGSIDAMFCSANQFLNPEINRHMHAFEKSSVITVNASFYHREKEARFELAKLKNQVANKKFVGVRGVQFAASPFLKTNEFQWVNTSESAAQFFLLKRSDMLIGYRERLKPLLENDKMYKASQIKEVHLFKVGVNFCINKKYPKSLLKDMANKMIEINSRKQFVDMRQKINFADTFQKTFPQE